MVPSRWVVAVAVRVPRLLPGLAQRGHLAVAVAVMDGPAVAPAIRGMREAIQCPAPITGPPGVGEAGLVEMERMRLQSSAVMAVQVCCPAFQDRVSGMVLVVVVVRSIPVPSVDPKQPAAVAVAVAAMVPPQEPLAPEPMVSAVAAVGVAMVVQVALAVMVWSSSGMRARWVEPVEPFQRFLGRRFTSSQRSVPRPSIPVPWICRPGSA